MSDRQRVAVITGASSGIGEALARLLSKQGWHCVLVARRRERLAEIVAQIGGEFEVCDVSVGEEVQATAKRVLARHPAIDLLVCNAGIPARGGFLDADLERIELVMRTNYLGAVWCVRAFLPGLEQAKPSHIVNVVSVAGTTVVPKSGPYSASKHAQIAFSRALRAELKPREILVHTVNPGPVATEGFPQRGLVRRRMTRWSVLQPGQIAEAIVRVIENDKGEIVVPGWMRIAGIATGLFPQTVTGIVAGGDPRERDD
jgi:short-subunit dehydrogenase